MAGDGGRLAIQGDRALVRALEKLPLKTARACQRAGLVRAMRPVTNAIRRNVPGPTGKKAKGTKAELLRKGIKARAQEIIRDRTFGGKSIRRRTFLPSRGYMGIPLDAEHYWPAALEYGHIAADGSFVKPRSFIRKGYDETERDALRILVDETWKAIRRAWK